MTCTVKRPPEKPPDHGAGAKADIERRCKNLDIGWSCVTGIGKDKGNNKCWSGVCCDFGDRNKGKKGYADQVITAGVSGEICVRGLWWFLP